MELVSIEDEPNHSSYFLSSIDSEAVAGSTILPCDYLLELNPRRVTTG